jgi:DNA-directed RNA polymerase subunit RPC12/RpoP
LGAPTGHPFFGNQYTHGGYVNGSFEYENAIENLAGTTVKLAAKVGKSTPGAVLGLRLKPPMPVSLSSTSIVPLIAAGTVVLIGGVATFVYLRSRLTKAGELPLEGGNLAGFGLCESCGEELAISGPAVVEQDDDGDYVVCDSCSHKNRARTSEDED